MIKIILLPDALEQWAVFAFVCVFVYQNMKSFQINPSR